MKKFWKKFHNLFSCLKIKFLNLWKNPKRNRCFGYSTSTWVVLCHSVWKIGSDFFWWQERGMSWYVMPFERNDLYHQIESDIKPALLDEPNTVTYLKTFHLKSSRDQVLRTVCYRKSQGREKCPQHKTGLLPYSSRSSESLETDSDIFIW
jgi:hypothetical protein